MCVCIEMLLELKIGSDRPHSRLALSAHTNNKNIKIHISSTHACLGYIATQNGRQVISKGLEVEGPAMSPAPPKPKLTKQSLTMNKKGGVGTTESYLTSAEA
jgi:hypothetical protein